MKKDLDTKLYDNYSKGDKQAFEHLYNKYKCKIEYFIYNIVKDYQKAEDLAQETFVDVIEQKLNNNFSFKYSIYMLAKSKAFNYIKVNKRRNEITDNYINNSAKVFEKDVVEIIEKEETKKEVLEAIQGLDERYKNAIYLVNVEGMSYEETAQILGENLQNTKNLIHRGKKQLRRILIQKGFNDNPISKVLLVVVCIILLSGVAYGITAVVRKITNGNIRMNPSYQSTLDEHTINNLWVGTFDLAWKELEERLGVTRIQLEGDNIPQIALDLNASNFSKEMLNSKDYEINIETTVSGGYEINAKLSKDLHFLENFDNFKNYTNKTFGDSEEPIKYFGINNGTDTSVNKNIEVLFYNEESYVKLNNGSIRHNDFAIKLKTKEGDEIILYRTDENKNFDKYYEDLEKKTTAYTENREFLDGEELYIPYVRVNGFVSYNELNEKEIKDTNGMYIKKAVQDVDFYLNERGCKVSSKSTMITEYNRGSLRTFKFDDTFIIFMKEKNALMPYFALKVDNTDILEKIGEEKASYMLYYSPIQKDSDLSRIDDNKYKFYEDENYEYYYKISDNSLLHFISLKGDILLEEALEKGYTTLDILDEYEIEYIKKLK